MQEVAKMVAQSCSTCSKAMRAEGIKVRFHTAQLWADCIPAQINHHRPALGRLHSSTNQSSQACFGQTAFQHKSIITFKFKE